jgi:hypothetical protein
MPSSVYTETGAMQLADSIQTLMAESKIRLFSTAVAISKTTTKAELVAAEATYDGYAAVTVTAFLNPYLDPAGGATTQSGTKIFYYGPAASPPVTNNVLGFWVETAAGVPILIVGFDSPVPMIEVGDAVPVNVLLNYGA